MQVLIVDDDPVYRTFVEELLRKWGFQTATVCNGKEALDRIAAGPPPDMVVLDWMMPLIDGYEVCRRLKQTGGPAIHVIMITGSYKKVELLKVLVAGADDYIMKPFEAIDLQLHVRNAVTIINLKAEVTELWKRLHSATSPEHAAANTN